MKRILFFFVLSVVACSDSPKETFTYYNKGQIKERFVQQSDSVVCAYLYADDGVLLKSGRLVNGLKDGVFCSYKGEHLIEKVEFVAGAKTGKLRVFEPLAERVQLQRTFVNDTLHGLDQIFYNGQLKEYRINYKGKPLVFAEIYESAVHGFIKEAFFRINDSLEIVEPLGQLVYDSKNEPVKELCDYYYLSHLKDTVDLGEQNVLTIEIFHPNVLVCKVDFEKTASFDLSFDLSSSIHSNANSVEVGVRSKTPGLNVLFGTLSICWEEEGEEKQKVWMLYDEFYVR